ncbi:LysR family transcriptional regulator [Rubellimicrobium roseum]|uniref:LysR family transcriptional regulator n=1 Tax=Rubellimicrobium roseum TaxID=687525 RepID=A0A5C4NMI2_9RHOB|nr:LysR family transcriptional regulator [Rubellimicrobium roseum]TNC74326.1 LysR family transcriptional regulator [Rubellimicrobium roseum]
MPLPSLTSLRAFEAAARLGGFSAASRELNVTHAAVAQQVRSLEASLGVTLLERMGRGLVLTPEGERLAAALTAGFEAISTAVDEVRAGEDGRPLQVTLTPAFASQWLVPRLGRFWARHPEVPISLHPDRQVVDLARARMDLAIRLGEGQWAGLDAELLVPAAYTVVGAPALLGERTALEAAEMATLPWIFEQGSHEERAWLRRIGLDPDGLQATTMPTEELALSAARAGYGLYVELLALLGDDLASGRLRAVHAATDPRFGFWMVRRPVPPRPALRRFMRWLREEAKG